jgi:precorrin-3B synthase
MTAMRRGACPRLAEPMPTGDGLLARLATRETIGLDAFAGLCAAARRHGNGIMEITRRGSIQIRGLTAISAPLLADDVAALDLDIVDGVSIITSPLSGLDPQEIADANEIAAALSAALAGQPLRLGAKTSVAIDGGGALHLDALAADVRLRALAPRGAVVWHVAVGGSAAQSRALGATTPEKIVALTTRLLGAIARYGPDARAVDRSTELRGAIADLLIDGAPPPARRPAEPIGRHPLRTGDFAVGVGLPFGHALATDLSGLVDAARAAGANGVRTSPGRALLFVGLVSDAAEGLGATAARLGFITRPDDPRRSVAACAGAPICGSAKIPARSLAPAIAAGLAPLLDGSVTVHVSGCPKGCAHSGAAELTIVGTEAGCGVLVNGAARDAPAMFVAAEALPARVGRLANDAIGARQAGESSADVLARRGAARIFAAMAEACRG